jgi:hypothetical protein
MKINYFNIFLNEKLFLKVYSSQSKQNLSKTFFQKTLKNRSKTSLNLQSWL